MISDTAFQACRVIYNSFGSFFLKLIKYQLSKKQGFQRGVTPFGCSFGKRGGMEETNCETRSNLRLSKKRFSLLHEKPSVSSFGTWFCVVDRHRRLVVFVSILRSQTSFLQTKLRLSCFRKLEYVYKFCPRTSDRGLHKVHNLRNLRWRLPKHGLL